MVHIALDLNEHDFELIAERATTWGEKWRGQAGRFENFTPGRSTDEIPSWDWPMAYNVGPSWTSVILAGGFLSATSQEYEVVRDTDQNCYWLLTNYETSTWRRRRPGSRG
ncbi:hypothetical protein [Streptomyces bungoensis]|uniref:hypothetical protein n=1 Tax=Streptomyces bungoensis TaxID=285568 RepID=UPI003412DFE6